MDRDFIKRVAESGIPINFEGYIMAGIQMACFDLLLSIQRSVIEEDCRNSEAAIRAAAAQEQMDFLMNRSNP